MIYGIGGDDMFRNLLRPFSFLPAMILMYMIYSFSAQPGEVSSELSYKVSYEIVDTVDYVFDGGHEEWQIAQMAQKINFITRKLAHMAEYFALAVAISFPLYVYGLRGIWLMLIAGLFCVGFACADEFHQSFVAGRSPSKKDVLIDSFGVFWGIILVRIIGWTGRKTIFRPRMKKQKSRRRLFGRKKAYAEPEYEMYTDFQAQPMQNVPGGNFQGQQPQNPPYGNFQGQPQQNVPGGFYQGPPQNPQPQQKEKKEKDWFFDDFV